MHLRKKPFAFTLVELLVVIGIIAVLIGILLPSLSKARATSQTLACKSNLRQLVLATQMFAVEHDGHIPHAQGNNGAARMLGWATRKSKSWEFSDPMWGWEYVLMKYMNRNKAVFKCPADAADIVRYTWNDALPNLPDKPDADNVAASYRMNFSNEFYEGDPLNYAATEFVAPKIGQMKPQERAIIYMDGLGSYYDQIGFPNNENHVNTKTWDGRYNVMATNPWNVAYRRHSRSLKPLYNDPYAMKSAMANYAFLDGHVETLTYNETWKPVAANPLGGMNPKTPWQITGWVKGLPQQD